MAVARFLPVAFVVPAAVAGQRSIVHVLAPLPFGGLENAVRTLAAAQRRAGHDVLVAPIVFDLPGRADWISRVRSAGVPIEPLVVRRRDYRAEWRAVTELVRSRRPSIVHSHGYHGDVVGGFAAHLAGFPVVATVHGFLGGDWKNRFYEWLQCRVLRRFDGVVAVSTAMADRIRRSGVPADRVHVVRNAFDPGLDGSDQPERAELRAELGLPPADYVLGWIGRLSAEKGADVMVRALARMAPDVRLSMIGDGPERGRLHELATELRLGQRVRWHGAVQAAGRLVAAFDAVVLSSRSEGTPLVLFEAMAAGVPVITTAVGGVPEVVSPDEALLVRSDDPAAIAEAVNTVRADPQAAEERARRARQLLARDFGVGPWLARIDAVYQSALDRRSADRST